MPARALQVLGQIAHVDEIGVCSDRGAGDYVFQFAYVARPVMLQKHDVRPARQPLERLGVSVSVFFNEMLHQNRNVSGTLRQPRGAELNAAKPVEKIFAKNGRLILPRAGRD